jgi:receptor protein-tyrosine kinase
MIAEASSRHAADSKTQMPGNGVGPSLRSACEIKSMDHPLIPDARLIIAYDPFDPRCEKIRSLRTDLLLRRESPARANMVALLSPCAGEGRSLLAAELAIAFAQTGHPTLLVDADLRSPQQHLLFGAHNRQGLSQAIEYGAAAQLHTVRGLPRMSLLTAGAVPSDPLELLSSRIFSTMIEDWRDQFEFVVIDTAPVGRFSDGLAVASLAGSVLALTRAQHTPYKSMQDMLRRLAATRSRILGAVISHF